MFDHVRGNMWRFVGLTAPSSDSRNPVKATVELYENGFRLGPANSDHATIALLGRGTFSYWRGALMFSSSDNTDPNLNGRQYDVLHGGGCIPLYPKDRPLVGNPVGRDPFVRNSRGNPVVAVPQDALEEEKIEALRRISMLHPLGLSYLREVVAASKGPIVEVGAHVGGATCAIGDAVRGRGRTMVSVEVGIPSEDASQNASTNVHADLKTNLAAWGLGSDVHVIEDWLYRATSRIANRLSGREVGLLIIDADGKIGEHMFHLVPFLAEGCVIVLDDYLDKVKGAGVASWVQDALAAGVVEQMALVAGGLWFGRLTARPDRLPTRPFVHEQGHCRLSTAIASHFAERRFDAASVMILEDGRALGQGEALHDAIRRNGQGLFSAWNDHLYFSTSDNSDPSSNGRRYEAVVGDEVVPMNYWRKFDAQGAS